MLLATLYAELGNYPRALEALEHILAVYPDDEDALGFKARIESYLRQR